MNAHTQPGLVRNAFDFCGMMTRERKETLPGLSDRIAEIELELAEALKRESYGSAEIAGPRDTRPHLLPAQDRSRMFAARSAAVLACMGAPATRPEIQDKLGLTHAQTAVTIQMLVSDGKAMVYGKRGHHWTYVSAEAGATLEAKLLWREQQLEEEARKAAARPLSPAEIKQRDIVAMRKAGDLHHEIAAKMKISRQSVTAILKKAGVK